jgi:hypothetical protein
MNTKVYFAQIQRCKIKHLCGKCISNAFAQSILNVPELHQYSKFSNYPNNSHSGGCRNFNLSKRKKRFRDKHRNFPARSCRTTALSCFYVLLMHKKKSENSAFEFGMRGKQSVRRCA